MPLRSVNVPPGHASRTRDSDQCETSAIHAVPRHSLRYAEASSDLSERLTRLDQSEELTVRHHQRAADAEVLGVAHIFDGGEVTHGDADALRAHALSRRGSL